MVYLFAVQGLTHKIIGNRELGHILRSTKYFMLVLQRIDHLQNLESF